MKKIIISLLLVGTGLFYACNDTITDVITYQVNEPVMMSFDDFRGPVNVSELPQEIVQQGKMCFYGGYLYVSEPEKGIHIIDNRDPSSPENIGFIELMGNVDLAISQGKLFADSYIDLVWFDINNPDKPEYKGRLENVFPQVLPQITNNYSYDYAKVYPEGGREGIIVGWKLVERKERVERSRYDTDAYVYMNAEKASVPSSNGLTGSMARFSLYTQKASEMIGVYDGPTYMYAIINNQLSIFGLSAAEPVKISENIYIGYNVETIFSYEDKLFMGTPNGLLIYSIEDPLSPRFRSFIGHIWGCDPVVVENNIAFVTVRSGNMCGQNANELIIIDVSNVDAPRPIATYNMKNPKGLGIDNGTLFLCDDGLKVYDAKDPLIMMGKRLAHYPGMDAYDVIPFNNVLMTIADDGIYQYDYQNLDEIKFLSKIAIRN